MFSFGVDQGASAPGPSSFDENNRGWACRPEGYGVDALGADGIEVDGWRMPLTGG
jgi:hypothetical protein